MQMCSTLLRPPTSTIVSRASWELLITSIVFSQHLIRDKSEAHEHHPPLITDHNQKERKLLRGTITSWKLPPLLWCPSRPRCLWRAWKEPSQGWGGSSPAQRQLLNTETHEEVSKNSHQTTGMLEVRRLPKSMCTSSAVCSSIRMFWMCLSPRPTM